MRAHHYVLSGIVLLCLSALPGLGDEMPVDRPYPEFQIGVTGIWAHIPEKPPGAPKDPTLVQRKLFVTKTTPSTPAAGKFQEDDLLLAVDGQSLEVRDPRSVLGDAINRAEGTDGKMTFTLRRGEEKMDVTITLEVIGSYNKTWPDEKGEWDIFAGR